MTYSFSLFSTGLVIGLLLLVSHLVPLFAPRATRDFLVRFPRSEMWGRILLVLATVWTLWLVLTIDLGEFAHLRNMMAVGVIVLAGLTWKFVDEFLAVRALAILALLAAEVLLCAAFLQPQISRLLLVFLAYAWIFVGLFLVGLPWLMRDFISWVTEKKWRLMAFSLAGIFYGLALVVCAMAFYRE
jgi:hypothetical protein